MKWYQIFKKKRTRSNRDYKKRSITVIWIHGANQSRHSFNYLSEKCNFDEEVFVDYDSANKFYENLNLIYNQVSHLDCCFLIGHSMGGIYALHLLKKLNVMGVVSISTPFNGSRTADWAKFVVPKYQLFKDAGRKSDPITSGHNIDISCPWTQIVSTSGGVPYHEGPNDGVCTTTSMEYRQADMEIARIATTHYEVMVSPAVKERITETYENVLAKLIDISTCP